MSIDGLLTFFGFLAAGYALLDDVSKLRLLLNVKRQLVLVVSVFVLIIALLLPEEPSKAVPSYFPNFVVDIIVWVDSSAIGSGGTAFLLVILWALLAVLLYKTSRPTASSLKKLSILAERLLTEKRYLELVDVVKPYIPLISRASRRQLPFQRLHDWLKNGGSFASSIFDLDVFGVAPNGKFRRFKSRFSSMAKRAGRFFASPLALLVPARRVATQMATDLEVSLLRSYGLTEFLVSSRADFIVDLMSFERFSAEEFSKKVIKRMMNTPDSHFFRELKLMDFRHGNGGFFYEDQLVLMKHLALNAEFACHHGIWKPVGDEAIRLIEESQSYRVCLLDPPPEDDSVFEDVIFCTTKFFDAMVDIAAHKGVENHMWLMYMSIISKELVDLHSRWSVSLPDDEFPTLGMRLIYEITINHRNWINLYRNLDEKNYHVSNENVNGWDNGSIVMCSVRDYAKSIRYIVASPHLPDRFKADRWSSYVCLICDMPNDGKFSFVRSALISEALEPHGYSTLGNMSAQISVVHGQIDSHLRFNSKDLNAALGI
jgi:hypothetical protein